MENAYGAFGVRTHDARADVADFATGFPAV